MWGKNIKCIIHGTLYPAITGTHHPLGRVMAFAEQHNKQSTIYQPLVPNNPNLYQKLRSKYLFKIIFCNFSYFRILEFLARNEERPFPSLGLRETFCWWIQPSSNGRSNSNRHCFPWLFQLLYQCLNFFFLLNFPHTTSQPHKMTSIRVRLWVRNINDKNRLHK